MILHDITFFYIYTHTHTHTHIYIIYIWGFKPPVCYPGGGEFLLLGVSPATIKSLLTISHRGFLYLWYLCRGVGIPMILASLIGGVYTFGTFVGVAEYP